MLGGRAVTAAMCARGRSLGESVLDPAGHQLAFTARGPGGSQLVVVPAAGGPEVVVAFAPAPSGRAGVVAWTPDGARLVYVASGGGLGVVEAAGGPVTVTRLGEPLAAPAVAPDGRRVAAVVDLGRIEVFDLDAGGPGLVLGATADFCLDPVWSPDGQWLYWQEWDVPDMPWDGARIMRRRGDGSGQPELVAGGPGLAVQQARPSPDGEWLGFLSDAAGWLNLWVARPDGTAARPVLSEEHEHGQAAWGPGQRSWAWSPDAASVAIARNEAGFGRLLIVGVERGEVTDVARGVHTSITWAGATLAAVRSGARTPTAVVAHPTGATVGARRALARGPVGGFERADLPEPEPVSWEGPDGHTIPARLYGAGPDRPLVVWVHGGPTDQRQVTFDPRAAWLLDRGIGLLVPDPRGSTGWGRAHTQALRGGWGVADVSDVAAGATSARAQGWGHPARLFAMGASSGGLVVLLLLARHPGLWAGGIDLYGPTDLLDLAARTHRFEAHYTFGLVAPLPGGEALHVERSPLAVAEHINAPLLVLHGRDDPVVPVEQSRLLVDRIRAAGGVVEHHEYDGEGHGWSRPETIEDELARIGSFLERHAGPDVI